MQIHNLRWPLSNNRLSRLTSKTYQWCLGITIWSRKTRSLFKRSCRSWVQLTNCLKSDRHQGELLSPTVKDPLHLHKMDLILWSKANLLLEGVRQLELRLQPTRKCLPPTPSTVVDHRPYHIIWRTWILRRPRSTTTTIRQRIPWTNMGRRPIIISLRRSIRVCWSATWTTVFYKGSLNMRPLSRICTCSSLPSIKGRSALLRTSKSKRRQKSRRYWMSYRPIKIQASLWLGLAADRGRQQHLMASMYSLWTKNSI